MEESSENVQKAVARDGDGDTEQFPDRPGLGHLNSVKMVNYREFN